MDVNEVAIYDKDYVYLQTYDFPITNNQFRTHDLLRYSRRNMAPEQVSSPGNGFATGESSMRMPHLEFIYRIVAFMDPGFSSIPNVHNTGLSRLILPIAGGTVRGPKINGEIVRNSGADWAQRISSSKVRMISPLPHPPQKAVALKDVQSLTILNARYTLKTDDGHYILVNAVGKVIAGPDSQNQPSAAKGAPVTMTQDGVEYFTHITFEAPGGSPYEWLNSVVAIGVMIMFEGKPVIDCYRLTNFPGRGIAHL
ncbi:hypothetical protein N0V82_002551 [Gnomoniopsis sp. IMI 355080]|nr:hypothetical protein N0V82_002551 [Gnomoniopsis sp. IMI 355080]